MCSKLAIKTPEDVIDVALVFLLLTFFIPFCSVTVVDFEQVRLLLAYYYCKKLHLEAHSEPCQT